MGVKRKIFNNFNDFINSQNTDPYEVCMFIASLLSENNFGYRPTGCYGNEWKLELNEED